MILTLSCIHTFDCTLVMKLLKWFGSSRSNWSSKTLYSISWREAWNNLFCVLWKVIKKNWPNVYWLEQTEINFLGKFSHPNLVRLIGYCWEEKELLLVYEYMPNGSLESHLFQSKHFFEAISYVLIGVHTFTDYMYIFCTCMFVIY